MPGCPTPGNVRLPSMIYVPSAFMLQTGSAAQNGIAMASDVATIVVALAVIVVVVFLVRLLRSLQRTMLDVRTRVDQSLGPVSDRARSISDNVDFITQALRTDVQRLNASVKSLSDRLQQASDRMEERIEEFNALMEVVQTEAEDIFLDTAATVRGVREGARSIAAPDPEADRDGELPDEHALPRGEPSASDPDPSRGEGEPSAPGGA